MSHLLFIKFSRRQEGTTIKNSDLKDEMNKLLTQRLSAEEAELLSDAGFKFSRPTRATGILVALYKKAASGDMTAIKEVLALAGRQSQNLGTEVTIIDDVAN